MPDAKRSDPKRRSPASRPARKDAARDRPGSSAGRRAGDARPASEPAESITASIAAAVVRQSEQRLGFTARRAAILAAVVCVLTLTIAGPVRTYLAQRTEMKQLTASEEALRTQIAELEQQKIKLADPVYTAAQARERLGFVMPGETPYQVQLPPGAVTATDDPRLAGAPTVSSDAWYTALWRTIADTPHNIAPAVPPGIPPAIPPDVPPGPPPPLPPPPPGG